MELKTPFLDCVPPLSSFEKEELTNKLKEAGRAISPIIVTVENEILDGHNRYEICKKYKLEFQIEIDKRSADWDEERKKFEVREIALAQRNLSPNQKTELLDIRNKLIQSKKEKDKLTQQQIGEYFGLSQQAIQKILLVIQLGGNTNKTDCRVKAGSKAKEEIAARVLAGEKQQQVAADFGITQGQVSNIVSKIKKSKELESKRTTEFADPNLRFELGDFEEVLKDVPDGSIDAIITDPPYPAEFIECWTKLARFAKRVLKTNGFCIAYSGQLNLPEVYRRMSEHLDYVWTFSLIHSGKHQFINPRNLYCGWKPILVYQNGFKKLAGNAFTDIIQGTGLEKDAHRWQQSELELKDIIEYYTCPGETILEPFAGGGTTISAALKLNRNVIAAEIDEKSYKSANARLSESVK